MQEKSATPFKPILRIDGRSDLNPESVSLKRLRDIVAGRDSTFPRAYAMALLQASDFSNKHRDFESLLQDERESPRIRWLAAMKLWRINRQEAVEILIRNSSRIREERVLAGIATALGRIGDKSAVEVLARIAENATPAISFQARFATSLISYRLGLEGNELPIPEEKDYLDPPNIATSQIQIQRGSYEETELCLRFMSQQPFGIEFSECASYKIRCGRLIFMILFNRDFTKKDSAKRLKDRKALLGVVVRRNEHSAVYSVGYLMLSSPARQRNTVNLLIYHPNGNLVLGGKAILEGINGKFWIRSIARPGNHIVRIEGAIEKGRLKITTAPFWRFLHPKQLLQTSDRSSTFMPSP